MNWKPVMIEYDDARIENGQIHTDDAADLTPVHCLAVGWLVSENEKHVGLVMERFVFGDVDDQVRGSLVVPRAAIVRKQALHTHEALPVWEDADIDVAHLKVLAARAAEADKPYLEGLATKIALTFGEEARR